MRRDPKNTVMLLLVVFFVFIVFFVLFFNGGSEDDSEKYKFQQFYKKYDASSTVYNIAIVSDMDKESKDGDHWKSSFLYGTLRRDPHSGLYSVEWGNERYIDSKLNEGGRSMELSDLCNFEDKLYSFDDRTGMVVVIEDEHAYPVALLMDGNGRSSKGFKGEWCTVKDGKLFIGGMGKEWTDQQGNFISNDPLWVKTLETNGAVTHYDWYYQYQEIKTGAGIKSPGYILNEAVMWIPSTQNWIFLPRRVSNEKYDAVLDEYRCSNIGIYASEDFRVTKKIEDVGPLIKTRGFSSVKFVPHRENEIVVLKTDEVDGVRSYIMVYDLSTGRTLLEDTLIEYDNKYEGIEFL